MKLLIVLAVLDVLKNHCTKVKATALHTSSHIRETTVLKDLLLPTRYELIFKILILLWLGP